MRHITLLLLVLVLPAFSSAATLYVPDDHATIQAAIDASMNGDTVIVRDGTYVENIKFKGRAITLTSENGAAATIIDGGNPIDPNLASVVMFVNGEGPDSVLDGFTLRNGAGKRTAPYAGNGGGIYCTSSPTIRNNTITESDVDYGRGGGIWCNGSPVISNNEITWNLADVRGGGILCKGDNAPIITGNVISNNTVSNTGGFEQGGGGIAVVDDCNPVISDNIISNNYFTSGIGTDIYNGGGGIYLIRSSATITNNIITENTSDDDDGGGIFITDGASQTIIISGNVISGNFSSTHFTVFPIGNGAGICCYHATVVISNNIISSNRSEVTDAGSGGGGIFCCENESVTITNNLIADNEIVDDDLSQGGGIYCKNATSVLVANNIITGNTATVGGGVSLKGGDCHVANNQISKNIASFGGGIAGYNGNITLSNNTISENSADTLGGGIFCSQAATLLVSDSILWNNSAPSGPELSVKSSSQPSFVQISYSDVCGGQASLSVDPGCTLGWNSGMIDAEPRFAAGPNGFAYLRNAAAGQADSSPCIDAGSDLASNVGMDSLWTRTDGVADAGTVDMGFHYGAFSATWTAPLFPDAYVIPENTGGTVNFQLDAGAEKAGRNYLLLGGISGTEPGFILPGGHATLPLNFDVFTELTVLPLINTYIFSDFMGTLDVDGRATAQMNLPPVVGYAGFKTYYAFCLGWPWEFASNPVEIEIVP
ncbi:MAG: right-handed parallel beta-helix repeat-containing protein [Planctomycetota bacterium]